MPGHVAGNYFGQVFSILLSYYSECPQEFQTKPFQGYFWFLGNEKI
jgi:hypothetical protein